MNETHRDIVALSFVPGVGAGRIRKLIEHFEDTREIFTAKTSVLKEVIGRGFNNFGEIAGIKNSEEFVEEIEYIEREDIKTVCLKDEDYPFLLKNIYDPPAILFYKGDFLEGTDNAIAVIGARKCSLYGMQIAEKLACDLAEEGATVVSGMARGIDSAAHRGAIKGRGRTIAVMGSGFRNIYPPESGSFARDISQNGAVITEFTSSIPPDKSNFPRRNRIISGLAEGVVVVEAAQKSGAMITVNLALDEGREVFAVPGRVDSTASDGTNLLIKKGAKLVQNVDDIFEELNLSKSNGKLCKLQKVKIELCSEEKNIAEILDASVPVYIDQIVEEAGIGKEKISEILLKMEMKGIVKVFPGSNYALNA